jgi:hypothetical protein
MSQHPSEKSQADKFREAARDLETDDNEARFDERLARIVKSEKPKEPNPKESGN